MKEFHRDFANRTGLAQAWTVKSADRLFTFCWFNASHYPFAQNLYQVFEDAIFVSGNSSCRGSCI